MDIIDVVALVKDQKELKDIEVYGYITEKVDRPSNLASSCRVEDGGMFVEMKVFAINLQTYQYELEEKGIYSKDNHIYFANGVLGLYVDNQVDVGNWYSVRGTLRNTSKQDSSCLAMYDLKKHEEGWCIEKNRLGNIDISSWRDSSRLKHYLLESAEKREVVLPKEVNNLQRFHCVPKVELALTNKDNGSVSYEESVKEVEFSEITKIVVTKKLQDAKRDVVEYLKGVLDTYKKKDGDEKFDILLKQLEVSYQRKLLGVATTGEELLNSFAEDREYVKEVMKKFNRREQVKLSLEEKEELYMLIVATILKISSSVFLDVYETLNSMGADVIEVLKSNPYLLLYFNDELGFKDVDYMASCFIDFAIQDIELERDIAFLYSVCRERGVLEYETLQSFSYLLAVDEYNLISFSGSILKNQVKIDISEYLDSRVTYERELYHLEEYKEGKDSYFSYLSKERIENAVEVGLARGIFVVYERNDKKYIGTPERVEERL